MVGRVRTGVAGRSGISGGGTAREAGLSARDGVPGLRLLEESEG